MHCILSVKSAVAPEQLKRAVGVSAGKVEHVTDLRYPPGLGDRPRAVALLSKDDLGVLLEQHHAHLAGQLSAGEQTHDRSTRVLERPRLHLVRETKSTHEEVERRGIENAKIACAQEHFKAIGTEYGVATSFDDLVSQMS